MKHTSNAITGRILGQLRTGLTGLTLPTLQNHPLGKKSKCVQCTCYNDCIRLTCSAFNMLCEYSIPYTAPYCQCTITPSPDPPSRSNIWNLGRTIHLSKPCKPKPCQPRKFIQANITFHSTAADHQHGFRISTGLQLIHHQIQHGMNSKRPHDRTIIVAIYMSKAFQNREPHTFQQDRAVYNSSALEMMTDNYLHCRQTYVEFRATKSKYRSVKQRASQGGALSPLPFNIWRAILPLAKKFRLFVRKSTKICSPSKPG